MTIKKRILNMLDRVLIAGLTKIENQRVYKEQNIMEVVNKIALHQTAEYVIKNMSGSIVTNSNRELYDYIFKNFSINGSLLEFGVFEGSTINYFADNLQDRIIYGFDSFEGLPEKWRAGFEKGAFDMQGKYPSVRKNVTLIKGWFEISIPNFLSANKLTEIGLLHIDCDLYSSTNKIFKFLGKNINKGTIIIFDEYFNYPGWQEGEFKAFQEFINSSGLSYQYLAFNANHEQVAVIIN
jgi:hypothetical protein